MSQDAITSGTVEEMSAFEIADQLRVWRNTFKDASVNFDARLLLRAADLLEDLQHIANEYAGHNGDLTIAYLLGVEDARKDGRRTRAAKENQLHVQCGNDGGLESPD